MNSKHFNQFKSFVNQPGAGSGGSKGLFPILVGLGLLWLAKSSIYYGIFANNSSRRRSLRY